MSMLGYDPVEYQPIQGPITYRTFVFYSEPLPHDRLTWKEADYTLSRANGSVEIETVKLDSGGYSKNSGKYYGSGMPLFTIWCEDNSNVTVRAHNRKELREHLKRCYPDLKVGR